MDSYKRDWGVNEKVVIQSIVNNKLDHLTGIEIARMLSLARIKDMDDKIPSNPVRRETHQRRLEIKALKNNVVRIHEYMFKVDGFIDLYPKGGKYFNVKTKEWGNYPVGELQEFIDYIKEMDVDNFNK